MLCVSPAATSAVVPIPGTFSWPLAARGKPRRGMLRRAVFSDVQRKALEKMFQKQKYISKPDRKKLAAKLGLKDSQVRGAPGGEGRGGVGSWAPNPQRSLREGEEKGAGAGRTAHKKEKAQSKLQGCEQQRSQESGTILSWKSCTGQPTALLLPNPSPRVLKDRWFYGSC